MPTSNYRSNYNPAEVLASSALTAPALTVAGSNGSYTATALSFGNSNGVSFYTTNGSVVASGGGGGGGGGINLSLAGSTTGTLALISSGTAVFAGGNNITLSQAGNNITISAKNQSGLPVFAGTQTQTVVGLSFSNSNNFSFGQNNGVITGSYTVPSTAGLISAINLSAGTTSTNATQFKFSNANNVSFGLSTGGIVTASASFAQTNQTVASGGIAGTGTTYAGTNVSASMTLNSNGLNLALSAAAAGAGGSVNFSAGTTSANLGSVVFSNANGVSFGLSNGTITGSITPAGGAQTAISGIIVSNATYTSGTVSYVNANGLSWGSSGANGISASYTVPTQTNQTVASGNIAGIGFTGTNASGTLGTNGLSLSIANPVTTAGLISRIAVSAGNGTSNNLSGITFANSNNFTFGLSTGAGVGTITGSYTVPNIAGLISNINVSAGTTSNNLTNIVFSNSNGLAFGMNGSTVTGSYTVPTQTTPTGTTFAGVNVSGSMTLNSNGLNLSLSGPVETGVGISANGSSQNNGVILFSNSPTVSFGMNGSTVTASAAGAGGGGVAISAVGGNISSGTALMSGVNMSFSVNGQTISGIVPALSSLVGAGGISISSAGSTITISNAGGAGGVAISAAGSNITSGTVLLSGVNMTFTGNGQTISGIVPSVSSFIGVGGISLSSAGNTITISGAGANILSGYAPFANNAFTISNNANNSIVFVPVVLPSVQYDRIAIPVNYIANSLLSGSVRFGMSVGMYSNNNATLSLIGSVGYSTSISQSGTGGSYSLYSGLRNVTMGSTATMGAGQYFVGYMFSSSGTVASLLQNAVLVNGATTGITNNALTYHGYFGVSNNASQQFAVGLGMYSATSTALPASAPISALVGNNGAQNVQPVINWASGAF